MDKGITPSPQRPPGPSQAGDAGTKEIDAASRLAQPDFPIVGIGCSAGGLEALDALLGDAPADSGMAFVIVQHLDPHHVSKLPELLQRVTPMPVLEAGERVVVRPGCVYVIPPNKDLSLSHGVLHLLDPTERHGLHLPIDFFLRTLADDCQHRAVGVILSGMGSDGMLGLGAIKEKGGLTLAQEPTDARSNSMPGSAIEAGVVDIVAPAGELVARIVGYLRHAPTHRPLEAQPALDTQSALERIVVLLRNRSGNDLSLYKPSTLHRRIERRIGLLQLDSIADYVATCATTRRSSICSSRKC
jgi:chemotaxis response regulator CheB